MLQRQNACGALKISRAIVLGFVTISLISLCLVGTPAGAALFDPCSKVGICPLPPGPIAQPSELTTVDVPGATDTYPRGINSQGQVAGSYRDSAGRYHGFVRDAAGHFTFPIDYPGGQDTGLQGINDLGQVAGDYYDNLGRHGFVRDATGRFSSPFTVSGRHTHPLGINNLGQVVGTYGADFCGIACVPTKGFVRDANGTINKIVITLRDGTRLDESSAAWIFPSAINNLGQVAGDYFYAGSYTGFVGDANGQGTPLQPANRYGFAVCLVRGYASTRFSGINDLGQITVNLSDQCPYVIDADGTDIYKIPVDFTSAVGSHVSRINNLGTVAGYTVDSAVHFHGFMRDAHGNITPFEVTGLAEIGGINDWDQVAGTYLTSDSHNHGFLWKSPSVPGLNGFSVTKTDIVPSAGAFDVQATFTPTPAFSSVPNPLSEPVIVKLYRSGPVPAWASIVFPRGSFQQLSGGRRVYQGVLHGVPVTATIVPAGASVQFHISAAGVPRLPSANPVTVTLIVGNNIGEVAVNATIH